MNNKDTQEYKTIKGVIRVFKISNKACKPFGMLAGQLVKTPKGNGVVIGVTKNNIGEDRLWFHIDGNSGATYFDYSNKRFFIGGRFKALNIIPGWLKSELIIDVDEVKVGDMLYEYHIVSKNLEPELSGFVGYPEAKFLFISEEVPKEFRRHILAHEVNEFKSFAGQPGSCVKSLILELDSVPKNIYDDYAEYRLDFFERLAKYLKEKDDDKHLQLNIAVSLAYLRALPKINNKT